MQATQRPIEGGIGYNYRESSQQLPHHHPHTPRSRKMVGKYYLSKTLGRGSMGKVKLAINIETREKLAVKIVSRKLHYNKNKHQTEDKERTQKEKRQENSREIRTIREANIMLLLDHPFIAKVEELVVTEDYFYVFMELVDQGQLLDYIISRGKLKEKQARQFARQIASALDYCHHNSVVHRDLKVENILISRTGDIKIIDFGLSNVFSPRSQLSTFCGSLYFAAPELLDGRVYTGPEVDVWSFGVVLYVLVCGQVPFDDSTMSGLHAKVKQGNAEYPSHLSSDMKDLLQKMFMVDPQKRACISEVMVHPWMNKGYNVPIENYLPIREPLRLPVDMDVVCGMRGFEFGSEDRIKEQLHFIISSDSYQTSVNQVLAADTVSSQNSSRRTSQSSTTSNRLQLHATQLLKRRSFKYIVNDPISITEAYHPLISIYYLVRERMECENQSRSFRSSLPSSVTPSEESAQHDTNKHQAPAFVAESSSPPIEVSYTVQGKAELHNPTEREKDMIRKALVDLGTSLPKSTSDFEEGTGTIKKNIFRRFSRRFSRLQDDALNTITNRGEAIPLLRLLDDDTGEQPPMLDVSGGLQHSMSYTVNANRSSNTTPRMGKRLSRILKKAASITAKDLPSHQINTEVHQDSPPRQSMFAGTAAALGNRFGDDIKSIQDDGGKGGVLAPPPPPPPPAAASRRTISQNNTTTSATAKRTSTTGRADECIKPVFLRGIFSVSTTSTKKTSAIRADIIRVLDRQPNLQYHETQDRFVVAPSRTKDIFIEYSDDEEESNNRIGEEEEVRFDIYIVKIPWLLGMRGIQFRRISGDPWKYKTTCSIILDSLHL